MLENLYQYAIRNNLEAQPGFKPKQVKAYILLSYDGKFLGIDPATEKKTICPDIGSAAQGSKCNILTEKASIILLTDAKPNTAVKHEFFMDAFKLGQVSEPMFGVCLRALEDENTLDQMRQALTESKYKPNDVIGFEVDGNKVEQSKNYFDWWEQFRNEQCSDKKKKGKSNLQRCLITGKLTEPMQTVPKISGLISVGGHSSGDSLICFDKDAFCSYNLQKAGNATVSEKAMTKVNVALSKLIKNAPVLAGAKLVHWYQSPVKEEEDICNLFGESFADKNEETDATPYDLSKEERLIKSATKLVESAKNGENPGLLQNRYYILSISGAGGRIMLRGYWEGTYEELYKSFSAWFNGLRLVTPSGKGKSKTPKLYALNLRLLKVENSSKRTSERMEKELSGIEPQLLFSIIKNKPLPDTVAAKALEYIRSNMLAFQEDSNNDAYPDLLACQLLKVWLIRKQKYSDKGEITMKESLNSENPSVAYQAGRMMAVFAVIQAEALGKNLGAGIIQRYYTSASTCPALVIGKLSALSQYHLSKIENKSYANRYSNMLSEIASKIGTSLPSTLSLEEQSQFALGYYQQRADIFKPNSDKNTNNENFKEEE